MGACGQQMASFGIKCSPTDSAAIISTLYESANIPGGKRDELKARTAPQQEVQPTSHSRAKKKTFNLKLQV